MGPGWNKGFIIKATIISVFVIIFSMSFIVGGKLYEKYKVVATASAADKSIAAVGKTGPREKVARSQEQQRIPEKDKYLSSRVMFNDEREQMVPKIQVDKQISDLNPYNDDGKKAAYLTFDDGPSPNITPGILDILKTENVRATFFVIGKMALGAPELVRRERVEGHQIGNHTFSHDYKYIYEKPENFIEDINKCDAALKEILGDYSNKLIRFPGGSFGNNREVYKQALVNAGYHYVDWNALNGDAEALNIPADKLLQRLKDTVSNQKHVVILMHDAPSKETTIEALKQIIDYLRTQGYEFRTLM